MSVYIHDGLDPAAESILLLTKVYGGSGKICPWQDSYETAAANLHIPGSVMEELVAPLRPLSRELLEALNGRRELWDAMFYPGSQEDNQLAWAFYLLEQQGPLDRLPLEELRLRVLSLMLDADTDTVPDIRSLDDLLDFLTQYPCSTRTQWVRAQVWQDPMHFYGNYRRMVELARPIVEHYTGILRPFIDKNMDYVGRQFAEQEEQTRERCWQLKLLDDPKTAELHIIPLALYFFCAGYCRDHTAADTPVYTLISIYEERLRQLELQYAGSNDRFAQQWRAVAEPRRMDILRLLRDRPLYGRELAERLKLTPATVSQHMSTLVQDGFVLAEKHGSRISYSLNRDKVQTFLEDLKNVLL